MSRTQEGAVRMRLRMVTHGWATLLMLAAGLALGAGDVARGLEPVTVPGGGGIDLAVYETGDPEGPPILFIHGFAQSHLAWLRQLEDGLAEDHRLVALDLRGHGASEKPGKASSYTDPALWAADVAAVIRAKSLEDPVLVGWSYGGYVIADYLRVHGEEGVGGLAFVGASARIGTKSAGKDLTQAFRDRVGGMLAPDLQTRIEATRAFTGMLTEEPMAGERADLAFGSAMIVPAEVRRALFARERDNDDVLRGVEAPTLVLHGAEDRIVHPRAAEHLADTIPDAELQVLEDAGHAVFLDDPAAFDRALAELAERSDPAPADAGS